MATYVTAEHHLLSNAPGQSEPQKRAVAPTFFALVAGTLVSLFATSTSHAQPIDSGKSAAPVKYLITVDSEFSAESDRTAQALSVFERNPLTPDAAEELWTSDGSPEAEAFLQDLINSGQVLHVEPDYQRQSHRTPNDSAFARQWYAQNNGGNYNGRNGVTGADLNLTGAWNVSTGSQKVVVAVIDNGMDLNHPDLQANLWTNTGEIPGNGVDDDDNGFVDDVHGWDFTHNDANPNPDTSGRNHGTAVAGVIGAQGNNGEGISGAAWSVQIMTLKTNYSVSATIRAMDYARANGAHIINTSFGGSDFSQAELNAINRLADAGVLMVASAGNEHWNNDFGPSYPGSYDSANILTAAASNPSDEFTSWSQTGQISVDVAAPGDAVYTTEANGVLTTGDYGFRNGTSFSSPLVAGVAALIKSQHQDADFSELKGRILASVDAIENGDCQINSGGRVNALTALELSAQPVPALTRISWLDGNNQRAEPNENATLRLEFETYWQSGGQTTVLLNSEDTLLTVTQNQQTISSMPANRRFSVDFEVSAGELTGHHNLPLSVQFIAPGFSTSRRHCLQAGMLEDQNTVVERIQTSRQDDVHRYTVEVPAGASSLNLSLDASNNLDLYLRHGSWPERDEFLRTSSNYGSGSRTFLSAGNTGEESLNLTSPKAGLWYVTVVNTSQRSNSQYRLQASLNKPTSDQAQAPAPAPKSEGGSAAPASGGGGSGGGLLLILTGLLALSTRRRPATIL